LQYYIQHKAGARKSLTFKIKNYKESRVSLVPLPSWKTICN